MEKPRLARWPAAPMVKHVVKRARHEVVRSKARARYERGNVHAVLDAGLIAHVGFASGGECVVIPMLYARDDDTLILHGSIASRLIRTLGEGVAACVSVTLLDGLVLARSHFHHSLNYRSVVAFGRATLIEDGARKAHALAAFVEAMIPGRAAESRAADRNELAATQVLRFAIEDASAKIREGPPQDDSADLALPFWAGVVPIRSRLVDPLPDAHVAAGCALPASVLGLIERQGQGP